MKRPNLKPKDSIQKRGLRRYSRTPLTTYYRSDTNNSQTSPFTHRQPKTNHRKVAIAFIDIVLVILLLFGLGYSLVVSPRPKVLATNTTYHSLSDYQSAVNNYFSDFKNHNKLTFDNYSIDAKLQKQFPEIVATSIELPFFSQQAKVRLIISKPVFLISSDSKAYVIDNQGVAVNNVAQLPKVPTLITVNDQTGFKTSAGQQVLSSSQVKFIAQVIAQLQAAHVPIANLTLPPLAQELDVRTTDQSYYVKFYLGGDALVQVGQMLASRHDFDQNAQHPAQYLDVRVPGKIFYK